MSSRISVSRVRSSGALFFVFLLCLLAAFTRTVIANPVTIQDASFDSRSLSSGSSNTTFTPWQETGGASNTNGWIERVTGFAADGQNHLGMNLNHNVWQDLGVAYQANTRYTLTVAVGNRSSFTNSANQSRYLLAASDGTIFATGTLNASTIPIGTFTDAPALAFETGTSSAAIGKTIRILLQAGGSSRSHFDRVRLTAVWALSPLASTLAATEVTDNSAILNGTVNARGAVSTVVFEYGPTSSYGTTLPAVPSTLSGTTLTAVAAKLEGLLPGTTYHYRVVATNEAGTTQGSDLTFTTETPAYLSGLTVSEGSLTPSFAETITSYAVQVPSATSAIRLTPATQSAGATIRVQGAEVSSGTASAPIPLPPGNTVINVGVSAAGSSFSKNYRVTVIRPPDTFVFTSPDIPAIEAPAFNATGLTLDLSLGFAPVPGAKLVVVRNAGQSFIQGAFDNLAHGQRLNLIFDDIAYPFVANYYGGSGNDLVLHWANTRVLSWGSNIYGEAGTGDVSTKEPAVVDSSTALAGKTLLAVAAGGAHGFALAVDGTLTGWGGYNYVGVGGSHNLTKPVAVNGGVLAGRTVVAVDAGAEHTLALCADGSLASWGGGYSGQLGNGSSFSSSLPVLVDRTGVLAGKTITLIAAGRSHSLVLCSDGTLAAWGEGGSGQLGNNQSTSSNVPVLVTRSGVLSGKTVTAIAAGANHCLALCSDGTLAAWGRNNSGQLGNNSTTNSLVPVLVTRSGVLSGKTVTAIAAGSSHNLALCADGAIAAWGENFDGQAGDDSSLNTKLVPVLVNQSGVLAGKIVTAVDAGTNFSLARCTDGSVATWGFSNNGQLGNGTTTTSKLPVLVSTGVLRSGETPSALSCGSQHVLVLASSMPPPLATTLAASPVADTHATLNAGINANGSDTTIHFQYGPTSDYGGILDAPPGQVAGTSVTPVSAVLSGLSPATTYHYRIVANSRGGTVYGENMTFTTSDSAALRRLLVQGGGIWPPFRNGLMKYSLTVPAGTDSITVQPFAKFDSATITVNGVAVASGSVSAPVAIEPGNSALAVAVTEGGQTRLYELFVTRLAEVYSFDASGSVPVTTLGLVASGARIGLALNHAPAVGANLTVVNNEGGDFIQGSFDNLTQGQAVNLAFGGVTYPFVADYFGGDGNDLVLQWANNRLIAWGRGTSGQLGNADTGSSNVPVEVQRTGPLSGVTVLRFAAGLSNSHALLSDGNAASWGDGMGLGDAAANSWTNALVPVKVDRTGVLFGKTMAAIGGGSRAGWVLCSDNSVAQWGTGGSGGPSIPALLGAGEGLADKQSVKVVAGLGHTLALCSDGTLLAWGGNSQGQLGNGTTTNSSAPVAVNRTGILFGKTIVAVAAGAKHSYALCSDGSLAAWGYNGYGQLGDGTTTSRSLPVWVDRSGVLAGRTVVEIAAWGEFAVVRCSDGKLAAWGSNDYGELGDGSTTARYRPVLVNQSGVLAGKSVVALAPGIAHVVARCGDGTLAAWGLNSSGQLGNGSANSSVPVLVNTPALRPDERIINCAAGSNHNLALVAMPPAPQVETLAANAARDTTATLNAVVNPQGAITALRFEYGPTTHYGSSVSATPATASGTTNTAVMANLSGLVAGGTWHFRVVAESSGGVAYGADQTFVTTDFASLASLGLSVGTLEPGFAPGVVAYTLTVPNEVAALSVKPTPLHSGATMTVNGTPVAAGESSASLALTVGANAVNVRVTSVDGGNVRDYLLSVVRLPASFAFASGSTVPMTVPDFAATGPVPPMTLNFAPLPGTRLTVVSQTGTRSIAGRFDNMAQGQALVLTSGGIAYPYVANYFGGDGNDLTLEWANTRLFGWGSNSHGQLGNGGPSSVKVPVPVERGGVLAGKTPLLASAGDRHALACTVDGAVAAWGYGEYGQLGDNGTPVYGYFPSSSVPVEVLRSGVLAGKTVVALAAGSSHSLALCSDGTLAAWGSNTLGQLGNDSTTHSIVPVLVEHGGVLAGKRVIAIAAGASHSVVLCADGTLAAWGDNQYGQLGNGSTVKSGVPVAVGRSGVLAGKVIVELAAGGSHTLVRCSDKTLAAWGWNSSGQLGNNSSTDSSVPVAVTTATGALAGKTISRLACGGAHNLVLCTDNSLVAWGDNWYGQFGNGTNSYNAGPLPVAVSKAGVLAGKTVSNLWAGTSHSLALCSDGTLAAWGYNTAGQLGNNTTTNSSTPVAVVTTGLGTGERFLAVDAGGGFSLGLTALPPPPSVTTLAANAVGDSVATLNAEVMPNGGTTSVSFEYGLTTAYGSTVTATPATLTGSGIKIVNLQLTGLLTNTRYHFRALAVGPGGTVRGEDSVFTTTETTTLAGLTVSGVALAPAFDSNRAGYIVTLPFATETVTVTATLKELAAGLKVNGIAAASGSPSAPIALAAGNTAIPVTVTAPDGLATRTYQIMVTRLPATFAFSSSSTVPVTVADFAAMGVAPGFVLGHAPQTGATLTVVNNTGSGRIRGSFANLAQGRTVVIEYQGIAYSFIADYFGGTGNDLVLRWANTRLWGWGLNNSGQLGTGNTTNASLPVPALATGALSGKVITTIAAANQAVALCADGSLVGIGGTESYNNPIVEAYAVPAGVLLGRMPQFIAQGSSHRLVLCTDGTLAAWGDNDHGQLGIGTTSDAYAPVLVDRSGVLAGKTVIQVATGSLSSLVLCDDGTLAAWGNGGNGQLGDGATTNRNLPVLVDRSGVLAGKTVTAIATGSSHSLVLCSDGTLAAWGYNHNGELGNGSTVSYGGESRPVLVNRSGVLAGKTVTQIRAGNAHSLVLCSDGTLAAWGDNQDGQLGNGTTTSSSIPVLVNRSGVLAGKTVVAINACSDHNLVVCSDAVLATWGSNNYGELGTGNTNNSSVPVLVKTGGLNAGDKVLADVSARVRGPYNLIVVAQPPSPGAATLAADAIGDTSARLHAEVRPNGAATGVHFEYGTSTAYGMSATATASPVGGGGRVEVDLVLQDLVPGTTYHYRVVAGNRLGTSLGEDLTFTTGTLATLTDLVTGSGVLVPAFSPLESGYALTVPYATTDVTLTPVTAWPGATVKVAGTAVASGMATSPLPLGTGNNLINVEVTAADASATNTYTVTVTRLPLGMELRSAAGDALTVPGFTAAGAAPAISLGLDPSVGTDLTMVNNTGRAWIRGAFTDLVQGQRVVLERNGLFYSFVVDYFGGTGNDLVLRWPSQRLFAAGYGYEGQLGTGRSETLSEFAEVIDSGLFASRSLVAMSNTYYGNLAVCGDGSMVGWGADYYRQLAIPTTNIVHFPTPLGTPGALAGRTVVGVAMGSAHSLVLCSDGALLSWGSNQQGQLGPLATMVSAVPLEITDLGDLTGKRVVAVAATSYASYALADDGTLATWGDNRSTVVPVAFGAHTVLAGRKVTAIAAGSGHMVALCADGGLVAWGTNTSGQLGNGTKSASSAPVAVDRSGVLAGKQVIAIATTSNCSFALCSDGTLAGWGANNNGELGDGTTTGKAVPVAIHTSGALADRTISKLAGGLIDILAVCADGSVVHWGGGITSPVVQDVPELRPGERVTACYSGPAARHRFVASALPLAPMTETLAASAVGDTEATLNAEVLANGGNVTVAFEYGLTDDYGAEVTALPASVDGSGRAMVSARVSGLRGGTLYHFRVRITDALGSVRGRDLTFTTGDLAGLSGLALSAGPLAPSFDSSVANYSVTVPFSATSTTVTAQTVHADATIEIDGAVVASGTASAPIALAAGVTTIPVRVTAADGLTTQTYALKVARVPDSVVWNSADEVPISVDDFRATGLGIELSLGHVPEPGTRLTLVKVTGIGFIDGEFANLPHGARIELMYNGFNYPFVANYFGGSGNDLVLEWANTKVLAWGYNSQGQLGDNTLNQRYTPVEVSAHGALVGRTAAAISAADHRALALGTDGVMLAWGESWDSSINTGSPTVPTVVEPVGVLAGKRVVRAVAGTSHSLALCADGTVAAWGTGTEGQLGNGTFSNSEVPVMVDRSGVLAGKSVVAIAAGSASSYALCSDGTVAAWGSNDSYALGVALGGLSAVPVRVSGGALAGRTAVALAAGASHCVVLCSDGAVAAWGANTFGQLGNNSTMNAAEPVLTDSSGVLAGKTVTTIAAGNGISVALCADGTLATWGGSEAPVEVNRSGVLAGKTVVGLSSTAANSSTMLAICADGSLVGWGLTNMGQLGLTNTYSVSLTEPVAVASANTQGGARFIAASAGYSFTLALAAYPIAGLASALPATAVNDSGATLHGSVQPNGGTVEVSFEYGLTENYGSTVTAQPTGFTGMDETAVSVTLGGLLPGTTYHYRVVATAGTWIARSEDRAFTTSNAAALAALTPGAGVLTPAFDPGISDYALTVPATVTSVAFTPVAAQQGATITVNGDAVPSGSPCAPLDLTNGSALATVAVDAGDGVNSRTYRVAISRLPAVFAFDAPSTVPATAGRFGTAGLSAVLELRHAPEFGANLTMLHSTGGEPILGNFANLAHGQIVMLEYQGLLYRFVANYYGGKGNDLVLQWADRRIFGWGRNDMNQLPGLVGNKMEATELDLRTVLAGRTILNASAGASHALLLLDNGTIASWGSNSDGQLGHGVLGPGIVDRTGALAGKTVVQIAAGMKHNLALCSDGTLVTWGSNGYGELGDGTRTQRSHPIVVPQVGALAGRRPLALAAGSSCSLVLCTDGTLVAWGENTSGQLGNGSLASSSVPVAVDMSGVLKSKNIQSISLARGTCFALCSDGTLAAWGSNQYGMVGDNSTVTRTTPVRIDDGGALVGKTVAMVAAGSNHNHALCTDGKLVSWGYDQVGQLGDGGTLYGSQSPVPVLVDRSGALATKTVAKVSAGDGIAVCMTTDGNLFSWGGNDSGVLGIGNNSQSRYSSPVAVMRANLSAEQRFIDIVCSKGWGATYAFVDGPLAPVVTTLAASPVGDAAAMLRGAIHPNGRELTVSFEYGLTTSYGATIAATPAWVDGTTMVPASAAITGLLPATTYHYRVIVRNGTTAYAGGDFTFTTGVGSTLTGLGLDAGALYPAFERARLNYGAVVGHGTETVTLTPLPAAGATVQVNGTPVPAGSSSPPLPLAAGNNPLTVAVTSASGETTTNYQIMVTRLPERFRFDDAGEVPVTAENFTAAGLTAFFELGFTPVPGTRLTAVQNAGTSRIGAVFDNLPQGQLVELPFGGRTYRFTANYHGGDGNDLTLEWAAGRVFGWGYGQNVPVPADTSGILHGATVVQAVVGDGHKTVLLGDGSLYTWGSGWIGQLGNGSTSAGKSPQKINDFGAFAGRAVVAVAAGEYHNLALCADGTLVAWGSNSYGQLGNGTSNNQSNLPTEVDRSGVLAGKRILALTATASASFAVCEDGSIAAWGKGSLGNGLTGGSTRPVLVNTSGVLAGRKIVSITGGTDHVMVLCADGFLAGWGYNGYGQLGTGNTANGLHPVAVNRSGELFGKTIVEVAAGENQTLVLCSDGSMAAWGYNGYNWLGTGSNLNSFSLPLTVIPTGALTGKTVVGIGAGEGHCMALCSDGTVAAWGSNFQGKLGNNSTTDTSTPVAVSQVNLVPGERFAALVSCPFGNASYALTALEDWLEAATLAASPITSRGATLRGRVDPGDGTVDVFFDYGPTADYGLSAAAQPAALTGSAAEVESVLTGLAPATTYHYRVRCTTPLGPIFGKDMQFTTATVATLADLRLSQGALGPDFASTVTDYVASVPATVDAVALTPVAANPGATIEINGSPVTSGSASSAIPLAAGGNAIVVKVTSPDGGEVLEYTVVVTRLPDRFVFGSVTDVPLTAEGFSASGISPAIVLGFEPPPGSELTLVHNTGSAPIRGTFAGLAHGQPVSLDFGGNTYFFMANYYGGSGNDLVLRWGNTRVVGWGYNYSGQLATGQTLDSPFPIATAYGTTPPGRSIGTTVVGSGHGLALDAAGVLEAAGENSSGTLGNDSNTDSLTPVWVDRSGVLAGKAVVSVAAGWNFVLAACADGTVASWGSGQSGELGHGIDDSSKVPVAVDRSGVLAGKRVMALAGGEHHALALCDDGMIAAWGYNGAGALGIGTAAQSDETRPLRVATNGALAGKRVTAIAAGRAHTLALCSDGKLVAWGINDQGQVGDNSTTSRYAPVAVDASGVLAGKTVTAVAAGGLHSLALCSDGTLAAWGDNASGQLGNGSTTDSLVPVAVSLGGVLSGKTITALAVGYAYSMVLCSDGSVIGWGSNENGQLGVRGISGASSPVLTNQAFIAPGERIVRLSAGSMSSTNLAVVAVPLPTASTRAADAITGISATLHGVVNARNNSAAVSFEYGLDESYGQSAVASPAALGNNRDSGTSAVLTGLLPGTTYHYRVVASCDGGIVRGAALTFTTLSDNAKLAALTTSAGNPAPDFEKLKFDYLISVANATDQISITPITDHFGAKVQIGGKNVVSGAASDPLPLEVGSNTITVFVTAEDGIATLTYTLVVNRLPAVLALEESGVPPVTADGFFANDLQAMLRLNFHPSFGSTLMVVNNTSLSFIYGRFSNLAHGQRVWLSHAGERYPFVANYYGGTGNDLVLQWAGTQVAAWGLNNYGQLGDASNTQRLRPIAVNDAGLLADKTIFAISTGYLHSVALCSDGTLASWGYNVQGQLGDNGLANSSVPKAVDRSGVLSDKVIVAISSGSYHNLALCSDGTVAAWGFNNHGQLGDGTKTTARSPVLVSMDGALAGKQVVAIAAGAYQSYALCSDGTLAAWGYNDEGELGNGTNVGSLVPVAVSLSDKKAVSITAGQYHALALCTDGTVVAWGYNQRGQLGNSSTVDSKSPVAIGSFGALSGKTVKAIAAGASHSLALCTDGSLATWGYNSQNQLGVAGITQSTTPVAVTPPARPLAALAAGAHHNLLRFTDGGMAAWGGNASGQLGSNSTQSGAAAVNVDTGALDHGGFIMFAASGCASSHNLAVFAVPVEMPSGLEAWRLENFGEMGAGNPLAGDCEDCDLDGIPNLVEYAFNLNPHQNSCGKLPQPACVGDRLELRFSRAQLAPDIEYGAEWSPDLSPGSWRNVPDSGDADEHVFSLPQDSAPRMFMRQRVRVRNNAPGFPAPGTSEQNEGH